MRMVQVLSFLGSIKMYLAAGLAGVVAIFVALFKFRGIKITRLEQEASIKDTKIEAASKVTEMEKKAAQFVADNRVARAVAEGEDAKDLDKYDPNVKFYI